MALTSRELLFLADNIKMMENSIKFMSGASSLCTDPQIKSMLTTMSKDHANDLQTLAKYVSNPNLQ